MRAGAEHVVDEKLAGEPLAHQPAEDVRKHHDHRVNLAAFDFLFQRL